MHKIEYTERGETNKMRYFYEYKYKKVIEWLEGII